MYQKGWECDTYEEVAKNLAFTSSSWSVSILTYSVGTYVKHQRPPQVAEIL